METYFALLFLHVQIDNLHVQNINLTLQYKILWNNEKYIYHGII